MTGPIPPTDNFNARRLKLDTLVWLRWLAVAGQTVTVVFVQFWLQFPMPIGICLAAIALSAWVNLFLKIRYPSSLRLRARTAALMLAYDLLQLSLLLYLTGGLQNPFAILLLVPVIVSATTMAPRLTMALGGLVIVAVSGLALWHLPLPWGTAEPIALPLTYVAGVWVALVSAVVFMGVYAFRVAEEARQLADALTATELVLAREQHLSALDGLAAAAAHELGTPLATIVLVTKELERELPKDSPYAEDVALLRSQSQRCRDILGKLTSLSTQTDQHLDRLPISHLLAEVTEPHRDAGIEIKINVAGRADAEPVGRRNPGILYGIGNLVENAVDFAETTVEITAIWTDKAVTLIIADDGPGFASDVIDHIGEPYVTTRARNAEMVEDHEAGGLGLGFFIAKTLLERTGAQIELSNRELPAHGAVVRINWPRDAMDRFRQAGRGRDSQESAPLGMAAGH
ncbi:ActS/PrrB/RegB family redox-sensitive histidine kinase [Kaistia dalseonensis]|uniref:histidine kinase n=1 Tax=Kaistia dalseonensis TaxID=410840 RepID=A0ABU0H5T7_9HYPH|nr:ActS/PrrB/RegB family redox-sensitive histidine kinase [Kaistia dalseonensis]MCX5495096.1 ActS/PrrB/RegB family redox-sensitive histidine kinase [Kaistia dalseonensis]MDQ0437678.1 two-component system sensor histidine kinase RegB [Kaistia dalseonensis]